MGHWVGALGILLSSWDYPKATQKIRCIHKKIRSSADTSARAIYQPIPPLFSSLHMGGRCGASYTLDISEGQASKL